MNSNLLNSHDPLKIDKVDLILELERASISASNYKLNRIMLHITDALILAIGLLLIYLAGVGTLPILAAIPLCAVLTLTSYANHASQS